MPRIDFPGGAGDEELEPISWETALSGGLYGFREDEDGDEDEAA